MIEGEWRFTWRCEFVDEHGNRLHAAGESKSAAAPMPKKYTITVDPLGTSYCLFTDRGGIRVLPGGKITLHIEGEVIPWHGEHTMEISQRPSSLLNLLSEKHDDRPG